MLPFLKSRSFKFSLVKYFLFNSLKNYNITLEIKYAYYNVKCNLPKDNSRVYWSQSLQSITSNRLQLI